MLLQASINKPEYHFAASGNMIEVGYRLLAPFITPTPHTWHFHSITLTSS
jgi:hypothetical protein